MKSLFRIIFLAILLALSVDGTPLSENIESDVKKELKARKFHDDQLYYLDSLIKAAPKSSKNYYEALLYRAEFYLKEDRNVSALNELKKITESEGAGDHTSLLAETYSMLSDIYSEKESIDLAQVYLTEAFILYDGLDEKEKKAALLLKSAELHSKKDNYTAAIRDLKQAHNIYLQLGKIHQSVEVAKKVGSTAYSAGEFVEAEIYLKKALSGFKQLDNTSEQIRVLDTLSKIYEYENRSDERISALESLITLCTENSPEEKAKYLNRLSSAYSIADRARDALRVQEESVSLISEDETKLKYESLIELAELYRLNNRETDGILTLHKANTLAQVADRSDLVVKSAEILAEFYAERSEWDKAYEFNEMAAITEKAILEKKIRKLENRDLAPQIKTSSLDESDNEVLNSEFLQIQDWRIYAALSCILAVVLLVIFLTNRRRRRKIRQILEWKVYKRTKELRLLNSELNTYIYKSSHDLRNPLTSIKSLITLLKNEHSPEHFSKYVGMIEGCADQMDEILLNLSRAVDYKKLEPKVQQISFQGLQSELANQVFLKELEGIDISWEIREKAPFFSDPELIKVILKKTILNSIQYRIGSSTDYCKVAITTDSEGASLVVEDNGQGITEKVKDSVFEMFVKGTHKSKGAGLGLYLVKIASDKLRGKITLDSEENKGSKLIFKLPNLA